jgi:pentose-5-phosphate-3-epimerase
MWYNERNTLDYGGKKMKIGPSIMCADFFHLKDQVYELDKCGANYYHVDIMDGHFVPGFTLGNEFVEQLAKNTKTHLLYILKRLQIY